MNLPKILSVVLITSHLMVSAGNHGVYYNELKAYKKAPATKEMFDKDAHPELAKIQRDIAIRTNLTFFQRWVRQAFLACDVIIATPETLPTLYAYVDGICKKADIATPTIFITRQDDFFNAAAKKLLMSSGAIIIGQKLMHDVSDDALEAVVAREIGRIKYNHGNKKIALGVVDVIAYFILIESRQISPSMGLLAWGSWLLASSIIVNKHFEKEADEFACGENGKSKGVIEFFELMLEKEQLRDEEFVAIAELLRENRADLSLWSIVTLGLRYHMAKFGHNCDKVCKYIYYNTFLGAHQRHEARIAVGKKYFQEETDRLEAEKKEANRLAQKARMEAEKLAEKTRLAKEEADRLAIERLEVELVEQEA